MADRQVLRAGLYRADHGADDHQYLCEIPEQSEGALTWQRSPPPGNVWATAPPSRMIVLALIVFLAPIYWIGSTAFKPRNLATTVPPTVLFQPEVSPFVKLFTKRVQMKNNEEVDYEAAPWWEKIVLDGGERISRVGQGRGATVGLSQPVPELADRRHHLDLSGRGDGHDDGLWLFPVQGHGRGGLAVLHPVHPHVAARRRRHPDVPDVPRRGVERQPSRADHPLHRVQRVLRGLADEGVHRRNPPRIRGGRLGRRLHTDGGVLQDRAARGGHRHRRHRRVLLHHRLERICLCADHDQPPRADRTALHPVAGRIGPAGLDRHRLGHRAVPAAGRHLHLPSAQPPAARHELWSDPQMTFREFSMRFLEPGSQATMVAGFIFLCQPWVEILHSYSVLIMLIGLVGFNIAVHVPHPPKAENRGAAWLKFALKTFRNTLARSM